ncbi:MAG: DedA family protein [Spirochaetae bacterium HGW-Spirochaetae-5]|nr:MAG: DedA family protein [Spirochaetae bacterium HGW-Spirochaetae-5]
MILNYISGLVALYMDNINYATVFLLMTVESSFIPFPSEIVVPPAAWKAANGELNIYLVVLSASAGCIIGALVNYYLAKTLGRKVIYTLAETKLAHMMLIKKESIEKSEAFFLKYGIMSTLIGRLVPAVRQLISIPAGIAGMKMKDFLLYTFIGSSIWNIILALLGYFLYAQQDLMKEYYKDISIAAVILFLIFVLFLIYKFAMNRKKIAG